MYRDLERVVRKYRRLDTMIHTNNSMVRYAMNTTFTAACVNKQYHIAKLIYEYDKIHNIPSFLRYVYELLLRHDHIEMIMWLDKKMN